MSELSAWAAVPAALLLIAAGLLSAIGALGFLRLPDFFMRMHPPQRRSAESMKEIVHRVQNGDTLWTISKRYNTTITRICQLNGFRTSQPLRVGQEIVVSR